MAHLVASRNGKKKKPEMRNSHLESLRQKTESAQMLDFGVTTHFFTILIPGFTAFGSKLSPFTKLTD